MHSIPLVHVPDLPLVPLHEDEHLLAFDKPPGLLCVPGRGPDKQDCLIHRVQAQRWPEALIIHRLDMATSGIVLMARHPEAQRAMSAVFAERQVSKEYEAIVAGSPHCPDGAWQEIDAPILLDWPRRPIHIIDPAGKSSLTQWKLIESMNDASFLTSADDLSEIRPYSVSRLALRPVTGRTHQLRVHLQYRGWPILGDTLYAPQAVQKASNRLLLHARLLHLLNPMTGSKVWIESSVPF